MFEMVYENICTICLEKIHTFFPETSNKKFSNFLCEKPVILVELFLELRIVVIQDSEDSKRSVRKNALGK